MSSLVKIRMIARGTSRKNSKYIDKADVIIFFTTHILCFSVLIYFAIYMHPREVAFNPHVDKLIFYFIFYKKM